jgi:hypothetical protein
MKHRSEHGILQQQNRSKLQDYSAQKTGTDNDEPA